MGSQVFVEREFTPPLGPREVNQMAAEGSSCLDRYKVAWRGSFLATGGGSMLCHFEAPDAEWRNA
jgi:hypothetical protein